MFFSSAVYFVRDKCAWGKIRLMFPCLDSVVKNEMKYLNLAQQICFVANKKLPPLRPSILSGQIVPVVAAVPQSGSIYYGIVFNLSYRFNASEQIFKAF